MATLKLFSFSILAASAIVISAPAISAPAMADSTTVEVQHDDLDLASPRGQERLKTRVKQAVKQVCGTPRAMTLKERGDLQRCEAEAMAEAMPRADQAIAAYLDNRRLAGREDGSIVAN